MQSWHMQCVLTGSQVHWTREVEEELHKGSSAGLTPVLNTCIAQLKDLVGVIRSPLPDVIRGTLSSLAVLDVHARDITKRMYALLFIPVNSCVCRHCISCLFAMLTGLMLECPTQNTLSG